MRLDRKERAVNQSRSYRSPLRAAQAGETRGRVLDAARDLFASQGYSSTSLAAVAERAQVSPDTIYKTFGSKLGLLQALLRFAVGGDDADVPMLEREQPQAMRAEPDQRRQLVMFAAGMTIQLERIRPIDDILASAAAVDPAAAAMRAQIQNGERREAMRTVAGWVAANGPLKDGLSRSDAGATIWALTSPELHRMLRDVNGWSPKRYERWLAETLTATLLPPPDLGGSLSRPGSLPAWLSPALALSRPERLFAALTPLFACGAG